MAALVLLVSSVAVGASVTVSSGEEVKAASAPKSDAPEEHNPRADTSRLVIRSLTSEAPDTYAGLEVTPDQIGLLIHVVRGGLDQVAAIVEKDLEALGPEALTRDAIHYQDDAVQSLAALTERQDRLTAAANDLGEHGTELVAWGVDIRKNVLSVRVFDFSQVDVDTIAKVVGAEQLAVSGSERATISNRRNDFAPWYGGDSLVTPGNGGCTSGFTMRNSAGATFDSTAGHCGNGTFRQGDFNDSPATWKGYGVTVQWERPNGGIGDSQLVSTYPSFALGRVFTAYAATTAVHSVDTNQQIVGELYCSDGYFTGEVCNAMVEQSNICVAFVDGVTTCGLIDGTVRHGATLVQHGDSGGPVYNYNSDGSLNARGLVTGQTGTGCCSDEEFFTQIATPMFLFGVSVAYG